MTSLNSFRGNENISMFSDHSGIKSEINNRYMGKSPVVGNEITYF